VGHRLLERQLHHRPRREEISATDSIVKGGWKLFPAVFFFLLNFSAAQVKGLFLVRLAYFVFLAALFSACSRVRLEKILAPVSAGIALILFAYGIAQKFILFPLMLRQVQAGPSFYSQALAARAASGRVFALFALPTLFAAVCGVLLIFIVHFLLAARGAGRLAWGALFVLGALNLVLTESFGGILFFAAAILFYLFVSRTFKARYLAPLLMGLALVLFAVTALRFSEARRLSPLTLRFANWTQAGRVIAAAPVLGVGLGNYEAAVSRQVRPGEPESIYAHNFFLQMAAETGLPLFALLVVLCLPWLKRSLPEFRKPGNVLFASAAILLLLFNLFDVGSYFFAAGVSFAIALSQIGGAETRPRLRPFHAFAVAVPAALLLAHAAAVSRQQEGDLWLSRREPVDAARHYRASLGIEPFSYRSWLGLAAVAWQRGDRREAELALTRVLTIYPEQPYANYLYSIAAWRRGALRTALAHAARAAAGNARDRQYQRWHEHVQGVLAGKPALPGS
jgi:O-antigen ligase